MAGLRLSRGGFLFRALVGLVPRGDVSARGREDIMADQHPALLKRLLLLLWAVWLTVVLATNVADGLKASGLLGDGWAFASGNYHFLAETTGRYGTPAWVNELLFVGVVCWDGAATLLFWVAFARGPSRRGGLYAAFVVSLTLWGAFLVADEVCIAYAVEATHLRLLTAQLVTLLAVELLPQRGTNGSRPG